MVSRTRMLRALYVLENMDHVIRVRSRGWNTGFLGYRKKVGEPMVMEVSSEEVMDTAFYMSVHEPETVFITEDLQITKVHEPETVFISGRSGTEDLQIAKRERT